MDRRNFLRRATLAAVGSLLVGDAALEAFERLTHRKVFALGAIDHTSYLQDLIDRQAPSGCVAIPHGDWTISGRGLFIPENVRTFSGGASTFRAQHLAANAAVLTFATPPHGRVIDGGMEFYGLPPARVGGREA